MIIKQSRNLLQVDVIYLERPLFLATFRFSRAVERKGWKFHCRCFVLSSNSGAAITSDSQNFITKINCSQLLLRSVAASEVYFRFGKTPLQIRNFFSYGVRCQKNHKYRNIIEDVSSLATVSTSIESHRLNKETYVKNKYLPGRIIALPYRLASFIYDCQGRIKKLDPKAKLASECLIYVCLLDR